MRRHLAVLFFVLFLVVPAFLLRDNIDPQLLRPVPRFELQDIIHEDGPDATKKGVRDVLSVAAFLGMKIEVVGTVSKIQKIGVNLFSFFGEESYQITLDGPGFSYLDCDLPLSRATEILRLSVGDSTILRGRVTHKSHYIIRMKNCRVIEE